MNLKIQFHLDTGIIERNIEYPTQNKITFPVDPGNQKIKIKKITLNDIETNIFYNTSLLIDGSDVILTSVHEITKKGVYTLQLDDLYILSHRSSCWHCSQSKEDYIFQYEFTKDSFTDAYRDRDHKGFKGKFIPCFGCSFTYGAHQPASDTWPNLLSQKTKTQHLNMGVAGCGIDGIYNNLRILARQKTFNECIILFPNFERRIVRCKINDRYISVYSTIDLSFTTSKYHFFQNKKLRDRMQKVRDNIFKDVDNRYSKIFVTKIINYCQENNIKLSASSWDDDVYDYLKTQDNIKLLPKFPTLSSFSERADDEHHPHKKHYQKFIDSF